MANANMSRVAD